MADYSRYKTTTLERMRDTAWEKYRAETEKPGEGCGAHLDPGERCDCGIKGDGQYRQYPDAPIATRRGCENNTEVNDYEEKKMPHDGWRARPA